MPEIAHGTSRGYQAHLRAGTDPCEPCKAAHCVYINQYRAGSGRAVHKRATAVQKARGRALRRLARIYSTKFRELYADEKATAGLD